MSAPTNKAPERGYHWGCHKCGTRGLRESMADARAIAEAHDKRHHEGKHTATFGWHRLEAK